MILWKGLSLIDSCTHLIHPSRSSSVAVDSLYIDNWIFMNNFFCANNKFVLKNYDCADFICLWPEYSAIISIDSPVIFMIALYDGAIIVRLAPLDYLRHITVDLKHPLLPCNTFTFSFREIKVWFILHIQFCI